MNSIFKKCIVLCLIALLTFGFAGCGGEEQSSEPESDNSGAAAENDINVVIKIADNLPETHKNTQLGTLPWIERIEELGEGKIVVEYYPAEQLGKLGTMVEALQNGVADIAVIAPEQYTDILPLSNYAGCFGIVKDAISGSAAFNKLLQDDLYELEYKPNGIKPLWGVVHQSNQIVTSKDPIATMADLKGVKIRVANPMHEQMLKSFGAAPVQLPGSEIYMAWDRGVIDGTVISFISWPGYQLDKLAKSATENAAIGRGITMFAVSEKSFNSWPKEVQDVILQASQETGEQFAKKILDANKELMEQYKEAGINIYMMPDDVAGQMETTFDEFNTKWAKDLDSMGVKGTEILNKWKQYNE